MLGDSEVKTRSSTITRFFLLLAIVTTIAFSSAVDAKTYKHNSGEATVDNTRSSMTAIEKEMIKEINLVRTNPQGYIAFIKEYMAAEDFKKEEEPTAEELIEELQKAKSIAALKEADCLFLAARDHAVNQAPTGGLEHVDTNNKEPWDRVYAACSSVFAKDYKRPDGYLVPAGNENLEGRASSDKNVANSARKANINLLIDHGVASRGHRKNILNPIWTHAGAFTYKDKVGDMYWHRWIQKFGMDKNSPHAVGGSSASPNQAVKSSDSPDSPQAADASSSSQAPKSRPEGCPDSYSSGAMNNGKYFLDEKEVSRACYDWHEAKANNADWDEANDDADFNF